MVRAMAELARSSRAKISFDNQSAPRYSYFNAFILDYELILSAKARIPENDNGSDCSDLISRHEKLTLLRGLLRGPTMEMMATFLPIGPSIAFGMALQSACSRRIISCKYEHDIRIQIMNIFKVFRKYCVADASKQGKPVDMIFRSTLEQYFSKEELVEVYSTIRRGNRWH